MFVHVLLCFFFFFLILIICWSLGSSIFFALSEQIYIAQTWKCNLISLVDNIYALKGMREDCSMHWILEALTLGC